MKIVAWNIRAGGGTRVNDIFRQLVEWDADTILLSEFRGTAASQLLARMLAETGWSNQLSSIRAPHNKDNGLLIASRWPVTPLPYRIRCAPIRWLACTVQADNPCFIGSMHIPNRVSGNKYKFQQGIIRFLKKLPVGPGVLIGDTNSGLRHIDEESAAFGVAEEKWIEQLSRLKWQDGYRHLHGQTRVYSWYSPNGNNGFRLDHAYLNPLTLHRLQSFSYQWGRVRDCARRDILSDHAAVTLTLA